MSFAKSLRTPDDVSKELIKYETLSSERGFIPKYVGSYTYDDTNAINFPFLISVKPVLSVGNIEGVIYSPANYLTGYEKPDVRFIEGKIDEIALKLNLGIDANEVSTPYEVNEFAEDLRNLTMLDEMAMDLNFSTDVFVGTLDNDSVYSGNLLSIPKNKTNLPYKRGGFWLHEIMYSQ